LDKRQDLIRFFDWRIVDGTKGIELGHKLDSEAEGCFVRIKGGEFVIRDVFKFIGAGANVKDLIYFGY
jgi:hypothetical protein